MIIKKQNYKYPINLRNVVTFLSKKKWLPSRIIFLIIGFLSTCWCLIRIIPKPSRASYPCMKAAAPMATSFIIYILGLFGVVLSFRFTKKHLRNARFFLVGVCILFGIISLFTVFISQSDYIFAQNRPVYTTQYHPPNKPIGEGKGINPGRVTWIYNPDATNENCTNTVGDGYWESHNNDPEVIQEMVDEALLSLTGKPTVKKAWHAIFKYYNKEQLFKNNMKSARSINNKYLVKGYVPGEKIFIKINLTSAWPGNILDDLTRNPETDFYGVSETSPYVVRAVLKQLIDDYGVPQDDITVGDPIRDIFQQYYELWSAAYPNVKYLGIVEQLGRTGSVVDDEPIVFYSDRGTVLRMTGWSGEIYEDPVWSDCLYKNMVDAKYMINIPALKAHARAGITVTAKNHFGSHTRDDARHLHLGLVDPFQDVDPEVMRPLYGMYRVLVDILGHEHLGGKTILCIVDGLWGGSEATDPPCRFEMKPFYNDFTSSILMSQDPVALESVCFDILRTEFRDDNPYGTWPNMPAVDDYLHQAASDKYWPEGIIYDPENDGSPIGSLGVHEHWDNEFTMRYSRNFDCHMWQYYYYQHHNKSEGIELVKNF